jgi:hypothetical protein
MHNKYAPIVLFTYNRVAHTKKVIESLQKNYEAKYSDLIIYSDGFKNNNDKFEIKEIRNYLKTIDGFNLIQIINREENYGLAKNIVMGVNETINKYGKVIVMEDDIVVSNQYLNFMNSALNFYEKNKDVWHICGWSYPISKEFLGDTYFSKVMNCWGWATWEDRWRSFRKDPEIIVKNWTKEKIREFDLDHTGVFWSQIDANLKSKIDTWAIFWYATIFEKSGLCLYPVVSYVNNIGHDGTGTNCHLKIKEVNISLNNKENIIFDSIAKESRIANSRIKAYYKKERNFINKIINKIKYKLFYK